MKHSEFLTALDAVFGRYGASLLRDLVLTSLDGRTGEDALAQGVPPRLVWEAICRAQEMDPMCWREILDTRR